MRETASAARDVYLDQGRPVYEYNMLIIERTTAQGNAKLPAGKHRIEVSATFTRPGAPADVVLKVDGKEVAQTTLKRTVPAEFTASETFDVGVDLGSLVSLHYYDRAPFRFSGTIEKCVVELK